MGWTRRTGTPNRSTIHKAPRTQAHFHILFFLEVKSIFSWRLIPSAVKTQKRKRKEAFEGSSLSSHGPGRIFQGKKWTSANQKHQKRAAPFQKFSRERGEKKLQRKKNEGTRPR